MFWAAGLRVLEDLRLKKWRHTNIFMALSLGYNHQQMSEGQRQKSSEFQPHSVWVECLLGQFPLPDHSYKDQAFDTLSLDSSDSMETSTSLPAHLTISLGKMFSEEGFWFGKAPACFKIKPSIWGNVYVQAQISEMKRATIQKRVECAGGLWKYFLCMQSDLSQSHTI